MRNKNANIFKGVLENAGLGEVAFYLKKAKTQLSYAVYALENTDFEEVASKSKKVVKKLESLKNTIVELDDEIDNLGLELVEASENIRESEGD